MLPAVKSVPLTDSGERSLDFLTLVWIDLQITVVCPRPPNPPSTTIIGDGNKRVTRNLEILHDWFKSLRSWIDIVGVLLSMKV